MDRKFLERYSRNIVLREIGGLGQKRLSSARILIVGAGGLGCPALLYLTASGVGKIGLVDFDTVSLSNLQRQVLFGGKDIGKLKVDSAKVRLKQLNPNVKIETYSSRLTQQNIERILFEYDLVLDGTDNYPTRYLINKNCFKLKKPLLFGAISRWDGQVGLYHPHYKSACFECMFPEQDNYEIEETCSDSGVLGPLVGVIGALMATEAIKYVTKSGTSLNNEIMLYEGLSGEMRRFKTTSRLDCKVCGGT